MWHEETCGVNKNAYFLTMFVVTWVCTFVKTFTLVIMGVFYYMTNINLKVYKIMSSIALDSYI